jgi:hypothetical protein
METSLVAKAVADVANNAAPAAVVRLRNWRRVPWILDVVYSSMSSLAFLMDIFPFLSVFE